MMVLVKLAMVLLPFVAVMLYLAWDYSRQKKAETIEKKEQTEEYGDDTAPNPG